MLRNCCIFIYLYKLCWGVIFLLICFLKRIYKCIILNYTMNSCWELPSFYRSIFWPLWGLAIDWGTSTTSGLWEYYESFRQRRGEWKRPEKNGMERSRKEDKIIYPLYCCFWSTFGTDNAGQIGSGESGTYPSYPFLTNFDKFQHF